MYPIYPLLCLGAALALSAAADILAACRANVRTTPTAPPHQRHRSARC